jgi:hypothetical protein
VEIGLRHGKAVLNLSVPGAVIELGSPLDSQASMRVGHLLPNFLPSHQVLEGEVDGYGLRRSPLDKLERLSLALPDRWIVEAWRWSTASMWQISLDQVLSGNLQRAVAWAQVFLPNSGARGGLLERIVADTTADEAVRLFGYPVREKGVVTSRLVRRRGSWVLSRALTQKGLRLLRPDLAHNYDFATYP